MAHPPKRLPLLSRRAALGLGAFGTLAWLLERSGAEALAAPEAKAKACIVVWLNGGASHLETFDPKPGTKSGGPTKAISTKVAGLRFAEHLPQLAAKAHLLSVVRGMKSGEGNHDRARHLMHTGYAPNPTVSHPSLSAWLSESVGEAPTELPVGVAVNGFSVGSGFLGPQHAPFVVQDPAKMPTDVELPRGVGPERRAERLAALELLEGDFAARSGDPKVAAHRAVYARANRLIASPRLAAFDIGSEPANVRAAYGESAVGRGCLLARRLVEAGVRFVEVQMDGWDTHQDNFGRSAKLGGQLDPALATLLTELEARKLLTSTLVVCLGDFGRTPTINPEDGRDHHPDAWSLVLAGGGIRKGYVHGETDAEGAKVTRDVVRVPDLFATMATLLGLSPGYTRTTPLGRPLSITDNGVAVSALLAG